METIVASVVSLLIGLVIAVIWMKKQSGHTGGTNGNHQSADAPTPPPNVIRKAVTASAAEVFPDRIVVTSDDREVMSMTVFEGADTSKMQLHGAIRLPQGAISGSLRSLIEPLLQVAPSAGTAVMANSSKLMEVVINGQMLAASDGNGFRAIAKAAKGFEHARLHKPSNLQNVANAAAMWQIASVIVAQKHLADISATLKRVESKVDGVQKFLEEARSAIVKSVMNYLSVAKLAVENGEFLERTRGELERFDLQLDQVGMTLIDQIKRESLTELERDTVGCEGEYQSALAKHIRLSRLVEELALCNEVRLANWYLCSVYPDNSKMLAPRLDQIRKSLNESKALHENLLESVVKDCGLIEADFTSSETINERRSEVRSEANKGKNVLTEGISHCESIVLKVDSVRADRQATNRLVIETKEGAPSAVYLCQ